MFTLLRKLCVGVSLAVVATTAVEAVPIIFNNEAAYLAAITPDFEVNVGRDGAGNAFGGTQQVNGSNIFSIGNDVNFSSPNGNNTSLVTVAGGHPELGPVGPGGQNWSGSLRFDFGTEAIAIGFGSHLLGNFNLLLFKGGQLQSTTGVNAGGGFVGVKDILGFDALVIDTNNTFWSLDGGGLAAGQPASSTRMMGQTGGQVPEPASVLLFGAGLAGLATVTRRRRNQK